MRYYDLSQPLQRQQAMMRFKALEKNGAVILLQEKQAAKTSNQNRYLHASIAYLSMCLRKINGDTQATSEYCKREYYKIAANEELFVSRVYDPNVGMVTERLRSVATLTKEEMRVSIDNFIKWCADAVGLGLPSPDDYRQIMLMEAQTANMDDY